MNILIIEDKASTTAGGAELSMRQYTEYLHARGHRLHLVYAKAGDMVTDANLSLIYTSTHKINVLPMMAQNPIQYLRSLLALNKVCRQQEIKLIITHVIHGFPMLRKLKWLYKVKVGVFFKWIPNMPDIGKQAKWGVKCIDYALGNTHYVADYWKKQGVLFNAKRTVIADGIFKPTVTGKPFHLNGATGRDIFKLLSIGRISEGKGLHLLIDALNHLHDTNIELFIAGKFEPSADAYHALLLQKINEYNLKDKVHFLGFIDNSAIGDLLIQMDLLVVPSIWTEARPRTILEAMALGKLVIGSRNGGVPETFGPELDLFLFKANDSAALLEKIQFIYHNKTQLEEKYRQVLINKFETEYSFDRTQQLLTENMEVE